MSEADSRLMHLVKGLCGGALMGLESFNELRRRDPLSLGAEGLAPSMAALVEQPEEQLRTAVAWCHRRQVFQSLVDGSYKTLLSVMYQRKHGARALQQHARAGPRPPEP